MLTVDPKEQIAQIQEGYFDYMARNYPVMCSCDEFYFFPRATNSINFSRFLDVLNKEKIKQDATFVKNLRSSLEMINPKELDLETQIDLRLLIQSMSTFLREFEEAKVWQIDPNLYLKIILFGIDSLATRFSYIKSDYLDCVRARLAQSMGLLDEAKNNLDKIPLGSLGVAFELVQSSIDYFKNLAASLKGKSSILKEIDNLSKVLINSLEDFGGFLVKRTTSRIFIKNTELLEGILKHSFSYARPLNEIFEIAQAEYNLTINKLQETAKKIKPGQSWQEILSEYKLNIRNEADLLNLYGEQIEKIKKFLQAKDVITLSSKQNIVVLPTPGFALPIRTSASYSVPVTGDHREPAHFYVSIPPRRSRRMSVSNIHNEYIFVTAHETYPGHHQLDSVRRHLENPIRRQIESALFYEGWASYAETLVDELGYIENPIQKLVGLRRCAWRAVRAMLDVGTRINRINVKDIRGMLLNLGYKTKTVNLMTRHYLLTPGYQLCYTIGKYETERLRNKFAPQLGLKNFHDVVLASGQIPFYLLEKKLQQLCIKSS